MLLILYPFDLLHHILSVNAQATALYLNAQIDAGAQAVIFDTWGGSLSHSAYKEFSLTYMRQVIAALKRNVDGVSVPMIVFTKGGGQWLEAMSEVGADALGLDWTTNLAEAKNASRVKWLCKAISTHRFYSAAKP